jgi:hypothetical protein
MLACIIAEIKGIALPALASINHLRFVNNGPQSLVFGLRGTYSSSVLWACITLLLYTTTIALQFTSTVLVADLDIGLLASPPKGNSTSVAMSFENMNLSESRLTGQVPYWNENIQSFPTFAEYREDALSTVPQSDDDGMCDTGLTHRAFIPLANESARTSIQQFSGVATVLDARVVCVRPKIHSGLSIGYMSEDVGWILNGSLVPESVPPGLILPEEPAMTSGLQEIGFALGANNTNDSFISLSWGQQVPFAHDEGWAVAQKFMYFGPALVSSLDPRYPNLTANTKPSNFTMQNPDYLAWNLTYYEDDDVIPLMTGRSYQLLNITAALKTPTLINRTDSADPINFYFSVDQDLNRLVISPQKEWLVFTIPRLPDWQLSISLCFDSLFSIDANISFMTQTPLKAEPVLGSWNVSAQYFDTEAVRQQVGATISPNVTTPSERGIFSLQTDPQQIRDQVQLWYDQSKLKGWANISFPSQNFIQPDLKYVYGWGTWMCPTCGMSFANNSNENITYQDNNVMQNQIFQDVISMTANSALAWQTYFTNLGRLIYYERLPYFDVTDSPSVAWYQSVQFPRRRRGLIAVMIVLCAHVSIVGLIVIYFLGKTRISRIGDNAWQSMVQLTNHVDMGVILTGSKTLKDGDIRKEIIERGRAHDLIRDTELCPGLKWENKGRG